jgi:hypothetical protein
LLQNRIAPLRDTNVLWTRTLKAVISKPWVEIIGFLASRDVRPPSSGGDVYVMDAIPRLAAAGLSAKLSSCRQVVTTFTPIMPNVVMCRMVRSDKVRWPDFRGKLRFTELW